MIFSRGSVAAKVDPCTMGLKNPQTKDPIEKKTRIQTTSMSLFKELDQRICHREHKHGHVAGTCKWMGKTIMCRSLPRCIHDLLPKP